MGFSKGIRKLRFLKRFRALAQVEYARAAIKIIAMNVLFYHAIGLDVDAVR
jgi:hypothetical protein